MIPTALHRRGDARQGLRRVLDVRRDAEADVHVREVLGRHTNGQLILRPLHGECPERGPRDTLAKGSLTAWPSDFQPDRADVVGGASVGGLLSILTLEALEPRLLPRGTTTSVVARGRGFEGGLAVDFLLPSDDETGGDRLHPAVTVHQLTVDSDTQATLIVEVAANAQPLTGGTVAFGPSPSPADDPSRSGLDSRRADAYDLGLAALDIRWIALFAGPQVTGVELAHDGAWGQTIGQASLGAWSPAHTVPFSGDGSHPQGFADPDAVVCVDVAGTALHVVDLRRGTVTTRPATSGRAVASATYRGGWVYWIEWPGEVTGSADLVVHRARADLTSQEVEVASYAVPSIGTGWMWREVITSAWTPSGVALDLSASPPWDHQLRSFRWSFVDLGGVPQHWVGDGVGTLGPDPEPAEMAPQRIGWADAAGSVLAQRRWDGTQGGEGTAGWADWPPAGYPVGVGVGGPNASGGVTLFDGSTLIEVASAEFPSPDPGRVVPIAPHPTYGMPRLIVRAAT